MSENASPLYGRKYPDDGQHAYGPHVVPRPPLRDMQNPYDQGMRQRNMHLNYLMDLLLSPQEYLNDAPSSSFRPLGKAPPSDEPYLLPSKNRLT